VIIASIKTWASNHPVATVVVALVSAAYPLISFGHGIISFIIDMVEFSDWIAASWGTIRDFSQTPAFSWLSPFVVIASVFFIIKFESAADQRRQDAIKLELAKLRQEFFEELAAATKVAHMEFSELVLRNVEAHDLLLSHRRLDWLQTAIEKLEKMRTGYRRAMESQNTDAYVLDIGRQESQAIANEVFVRAVRQAGAKNPMPAGGDFDKMIEQLSSLQRKEADFLQRVEESFGSRSF